MTLLIFRLMIASEGSDQRVPLVIALRHPRPHPAPRIISADTDTVDDSVNRLTEAPS